MNYTNYVDHFCGNGRTKVGITGDFQKRKRYYIQEARRHGLFPVSFRISHTDSVESARIVENAICHALKDSAIDKHREWFITSYDEYLQIAELTKAACDEVAA